MTARTVLLLAGILTTGLVSGLLYGWTVSVIPGLRQLSDHTYVSTMQSINKAIINPGFVVPFIFTPLVLAIAAVLQFRAGESRRGWLLASAAITYVVGVLAITFGGNIPLNNSLDEFDIATSLPEAISQQRRDYEGPWNLWHYGRTLASVATFMLASAAALVAVESE